MSSTARAWKIAAATFAIAAAAVVTFVYPRRNGLEFDFDSSPRAQAARNREPYDLTEQKVMIPVLRAVQDRYVDPSRVVPRKMLLAGLNALQRSIAPVIVHHEEDAPTLTLQVHDQRRTFRVDDVRAPWDLRARFKEIFEFLQPQLRDEDVELPEVEYAAINGMLRTLDPHSVLLSPEVYADMRTQTRGEFGGLGIVISIRDGRLTVIRPMPGTPAEREGLRRGDRIVKINDEATLNMPLTEAVNRLRGVPGSRVSVWVVREGNGGWQQPRRFDLTRAVIHIESVESRMLADGVGYISIKSFQGNTFEDMRAALQQLHRQPMRGLVLDLRDNPGGLLEQAVQVADAFLTSGTIVTTSSSDADQRDEKFAVAADTEPNYPMIVLVNRGSASASEIVAGALKNHDRALIVGERTFGKGSVQMLYDMNDGAALKLTISQYLTPGDVSIQGVGITPDILIDPMTVDAEDMDLSVDANHVRESDLRAHLTNANAPTADRPLALMRYYLSSETRQRLRDAGPDGGEENVQEGEFLTRFSRELLARATRPGRREMFDDAAPVIASVRDAELAKAAQELRRLGVDWSTGPDEGASTLIVEATTNRPNNEATAGEEFELRVRVQNTGTSTLYQLRATTKSDYPLFDERELVFGKLGPGQSREWSTTLGLCETKDGRRRCTLPRDTLERADGIRIEFTDLHSHTLTPGEIRTTVRALPRPQFAYSVQTTDNVRGDGDGVVELGEAATMFLRVKNTGRGPTMDAEANLSNASGRGILLRDGRFQLDGMQPGEERTVAFTFDVLEDFSSEEAKFDVSIADTDLREFVAEKLRVRIGAPTASPGVWTARADEVVIRDGATLVGDSTDTAASIARVSGGTVRLRAVSASSTLVRVVDRDGRPLWVRSADLVAGTPAGAGRLDYILDHAPPQLELDFGGATVSTAPTLRLRGTAADDSVVRDVYVYVGARKVFYQSNRSGGDTRRAAFETALPLQPGINYVTVTARESHEIATRRTFVVRRDGPDGALLETPRHDDDAELDAGDEE